MSHQVIPDKLKEAARRAIDLNLPFALFALPGSEEFEFFASRPDEETDNAINFGRVYDNDKKAFFITPFAAPLIAGFMVSNDLSADDVLALPTDTEVYAAADIVAHPSSTTYPVYYGQIRTMRNSINHRQLQKVVLSRRIAAATDRDPVDIADDYFSSLPSTFRALFFTQETGLWLSATPELLLAACDDPDADRGEIIFESMALAGTRNRRIDTAWDDKNNREHSIVTDFIRENLVSNGLTPTIERAGNMAFGDIEHLCEKITARGNCNVFDLLDELSPTPALSGLPTHKAIKLIAETELHNRQCYGGLIGLYSYRQLKAYVNIRCALLSPGQAAEGKTQVNIFAGGGIMKDSRAADEWREAAAKALPLYRLVSPSDSESIFEIPAPWEAL